MRKWLHNKLHGTEREKNNVYRSPKEPNPTRGWLREPDLKVGDLWLDTKNGHTGYTWTGDEWRCIS